MNNLSVLFLFFILSGCSASQSLPDELNEISGLTGTPSGAFWALADSGNEPALYRINPENAAVLETKRLPVPNKDWEELTADDQGHLYIGDFGNNANKRRDLRIFCYDPSTNLLDSILFSFPDQKEFPPESDVERRFDCEAMVWRNDTLHLFTKSRFKGNKKTHHYTLPAEPGTYIAKHCDSLLLPRVITGAALSPDGKTLALCGYIGGFRLRFIPYYKASVFFLEGKEGDCFFARTVRKRRLPQCLLPRQYESIAWFSAQKWLIANEIRGPVKPRFQKIRQR